MSLQSVRAAKVAYWEGDVAAALRLMPNRMTREKAVLRVRYPFNTADHLSI